MVETSRAAHRPERDDGVAITPGGMAGDASVITLYSVLYVGNEDAGLSD